MNTKMLWQVAVGAAVAVFAASCGKDLREDFPFDGDLPDGVYVTTEDLGDGAFRTEVDATNKTSSVYLDLDSGAQLSADEALESNNWDLAFQRFKITSNGGGGGPGEVSVAVLENQTFEDLAGPPGGPYLQDSSETVFNGPSGGWYYYDLGRHRLFPRPELTYAVKSTEGRIFAMKMLSYYDAKGTAAKVSFLWKEVSGP